MSSPHLECWTPGNPRASSQSQAQYVLLEAGVLNSAGWEPADALTGYRHLPTVGGVTRTLIGMSGSSVSIAETTIGRVVAGLRAGHCCRTGALRRGTSRSSGRCAQGGVVQVDPDNPCDPVEIDVVSEQGGPVTPGD